MRGSAALDQADASILERLRESGRCQQRLLTDGGRHYVFCGGYFHGKTKETSGGLRCTHHRKRNGEPSA